MNYFTTSTFGLCLLLCFQACQAQKTEEARADQGDYLSLDEIKFDAAVDDPNFKPCGDPYTYQYFNNSQGMEYKGEKPALVEEFQQRYKEGKAKKESGLIRIRFVVNCEGKTGRFRLLGMDENYQEKTFDSSITDQLMRITQSLNGWLPKTYYDKKIDYYQYLIFKIKDGALIKILP